MGTSSIRAAVVQSATTLFDTGPLGHVNWSPQRALVPRTAAPAPAASA